MAEMAVQVQVREYDDCSEARHGPAVQLIRASHAAAT